MGPRWAPVGPDWGPFGNAALVLASIAFIIEVVHKSTFCKGKKHTTKITNKRVPIFFTSPYSVVNCDFLRKSLFPAECPGDKLGVDLKLFFPILENIFSTFLTEKIKNNWTNFF